MRIVTLVEHEGLDTEQPKSASLFAQTVDIFLAAVADENQCTDPLLLRLFQSVAQDLADLGATAQTTDLQHPTNQIARI